MIRITEELWDKYDQEVRKAIHNDYTEVKELDYYLEVMKRIVGKHVNSINLSVPTTTFDGEIECNKYFTKIIPEKFNLDPGYQTILQTGKGSFTAPFGMSYGETNNGFGEFMIQPLMLFGDDLCIVLCKYSSKNKPEKKRVEEVVGIEENAPFDKDKSHGIIVGSYILYTTDSIQKALEVLEDYSSFSKTLPSIPPPAEDTIPVKFVYRSRNGLDTYERDVKIPEITLSEFNTDLPDSKVKEELRKDGSGLLIFHGEPGCGKSSYIKYLIGSMKDKNFIIASQDLLVGSMDEFRTFLLQRCNDDSVIIIEDCENLVKSREQVGSSIVISDFLNITDGIYGDLFRIKFILTFNTEIQKIDSALLRKGRLRCKYKFSKLKGEKLKALAKELGVELRETQLEVGLTLADLYNFNEETGVGETKRTRIGFKN